MTQPVELLIEGDQPLDAPIALRSAVLGGLGRPMSRIILGMSAPAADLPGLWDRYVELGGNTIDSARWYPHEVAFRPGRRSARRRSRRSRRAWPRPTCR